MSSQASSEASQPQLAHGESVALQVNKQTPVRANHATFESMLTARVRIAPDYAPYKGPAISTPSKTPVTVKTSSTTPVAKKRPASNALTFVSVGVDTSSPGNPPKRLKTQETRFSPSTTKYTNKRAVFNQARPPKNADEINHDIWTTILSFSHPRFLIRAKTVSKAWYNILERESIWRHSRLLHFDENVPECPDGITEQQYADLLCGRGCQSASCPREKTTAVCWALLVRLCPDCLQAKTIRLQDLPQTRRYTCGPAGIGATVSQPLEDALPMLFSSTSHRTELREVRSNNAGQLSYADLSRIGTYRFSRSAYNALEAEYLAMQSQLNDQGMLDWFKKKQEPTLKNMSERAKIATWAQRAPSPNSGVLRQRAEFFIAKAEELDPPMAESTLKCFTAYRNALTSRNAPTDRAWEILRSKIEPLRPRAEALDKAARKTPPPADADTQWNLLKRHRIGYPDPRPLPVVPEQQAVLSLARPIFQRHMHMKVADADLLLTTLKAVYHEYQKLEQKPRGTNFDGRVGEYRLSLDDARMIVDHVIARELSPRSSRGVAVLDKLRCGACVNSKSRDKHYNFEKLFEHLLGVHGQTVGPEEDESQQFWRYALADRPHHTTSWNRVGQFPWYTVEWPAALPIFDENPRINDLPPSGSSAPVPKSAFEGRKATMDGASTGLTFVDFFKYAAQKLHGLRMPGPALTKIALQFAINMSAERQLELPNLRAFLEAVPEIQRLNPSMDFKFNCGACTRTSNGKGSSRYVANKIPYEALAIHWSRRHEIAWSPVRRRRGAEQNSSLDGDHVDGHDVRHWTEDFWQLPSNVQIAEEIAACDAKLAERKRDLENIGKNARRMSKLKSGVVLATRPASEVFDELFVKL
ncbi:uncharacterized protein AB675_338 [Cyphellophora attinorum]|uniref:F-box domain-containing protein n=1 Tax=Cyphellophora attinorum TaxID=1664694 RepID=A0A0N1I1Q3_9EURO|nr:uncharacterized protein AB675_338 [Phialophora attinorum]KPI45874.1 hypothetical protein AB675_338 [Phialophora attinorum]